MTTAGLTTCQTGWLAMSLGETNSYELLDTEQALADYLSPMKRVLVDVPIGLVEDQLFRPCDLYVKEKLGSDSGIEVIPPPIRPSLVAPTFAEANMETFERTGEPLSVKSWALTPRIRQLESLIRNSPDLKEVLLESHPELLLYTLNGQRIYQKRGTRKGLRHRMELVASVFPDVADFFRDIKEEFRRNEVEEVDIVRAAALAWGAVKSVETGLTTVPEKPDVDSEGMKRAIHLLDR